MTPKQMGRLGLYHIQEATLEVLSEAPEGLQPAEISRRIGIAGYPDEDELALKFAIVWGALIYLKHDNLVEKIEDTPRWKLTQHAS